VPPISTADPKAMERNFANLRHILTCDVPVVTCYQPAIEFPIEGFNAFNHTQFYGPAVVDGQLEDPSFGQIASAAAPRLVQVATMFTF